MKVFIYSLIKITIVTLRNKKKSLFSKCVRCEESATPRHYVLWLGRNAACELRLNAKQIRKIEYINGRRVPRPFSPSILTPEKKNL